MFPFLFWFRDYSGKHLINDFIAGITVALVLIPQSMAYAQLAGLPAYYGLYASFLPPMVAAMFGSSRRLATGPVAVVSIMTAATLEPLAIAGGEAYIAYAILLAFCVGVFQFLLGVLRLGVIVNLLSHPVIIGFVNAAALIIASSQLPKFFGVHVDKAEHYYQTMARVAEAAINFIHWPTFFMGVLAIVIMAGCKRKHPGLPCVLFAVVITTWLSWFTNFEQNRSVNVADIHIPGLMSKINQLVSNLDRIQQTVSVRTAITNGSDTSPSPEAGQTENVCASCHSIRGIGLKELKNGDRIAKNEVIPLRKVLELHLMAGVLNQYLAEEKKHAVELRKELRSLRLVAVKGEANSIYYLPEDKLGNRERADTRIWRMRISNKQILPEDIQLIGGGEVVGNIPPGLPSISMPHLDFSIMGKLILPAIIISILGFMEAISIAKDMAARSGYRLDPNQELIGQGLANLAGSFSGSYPVSGSFSRSAVNFQAGAVSGMSSVFTSIAVIITLLFCTPLLYHLPQSVLAAIIMMAVVGLLNIKDVRHAFTVRRADGIICLITFFSSLFFAPHLDRGIMIGVLLSAGVFFYKRMRPTIAELSLWEDNHFRDTRLFNLAQCKYIAVIRFDGPLFYGNISYLEDEILKIIHKLPELKIIHFKCNGINGIDTSGEHALAQIVDRLHAAGYNVFFSGLKAEIVEIIERSGLLYKIGSSNLFPTLATALDTIWDIGHRESDEEICPLKKVVKVTQDT
ncbi:MAG: sodium-independent anion transporter [Deltaproteobacteria bacterium]|nr:MAG: sodium-independent anion transporter [Deltaproteobacteria bacterium]